MTGSRELYIIAVDFMTDFLATFATGLGVGVAGSSAVVAPPIPTKWMVYVACIGGLVTALRGLKRNLTQPVVPSSVPPSAPVTG